MEAVIVTAEKGKAVYFFDAQSLERVLRRQAVGMVMVCPFKGCIWIWKSRERRIIGR